MAGRSLREVEQREDLILRITALAGLLILVVLAAAAVVAAWLWPAGDGNRPAP